MRYCPLASTTRPVFGMCPPECRTRTMRFPLMTTVVSGCIVPSATLISLAFVIVSVCAAAAAVKAKRRSRLFRGRTASWYWPTIALTKLGVSRFGRERRSSRGGQGQGSVRGENVNISKSFIFCFDIDGRSCRVFWQPPLRYIAYRNLQGGVFVFAGSAPSGAG